MAHIQGAILGFRECMQHPPKNQALTSTHTCQVRWAAGEGERMVDPSSIGVGMPRFYGEDKA